METLKINDGTTMQITRLPDIDDETWAEAFRGAMVENPQASSNSFQTSQHLELEVKVFFLKCFFCVWSWTLNYQRLAWELYLVCHHFPYDSMASKRGWHWNWMDHQVKTYVESNPDTAKALQNFAKNPDAMRGWLQTQAGHMLGRTTSGEKETFGNPWALGQWFPFASFGTPKWDPIIISVFFWAIYIIASRYPHIYNVYIYTHDFI